VTSGCHHADRKIDPSLWAQVTSRVRVANRPVVILTTPFLDRRSQPQRCGMLKGTREMGNIVCTSPPQIWLAALLAEDLRRSGFVVLDQQSADSDLSQAVRVDGVLTQFFVEPDVSNDYSFFATAADQVYVPEADIAVELHAHGVHFEAQRRIYVKGLADRDHPLFADVHRQALDRSVSEALGKMVLAIVELVNLAPGLEAAR
jgi:hypothetical protein